MSTPVLEPQVIPSELTIADVFPYEEPQDGDEPKTHVVTEANNLHIWKPGMAAQDIVDTARIMGLEVTALCGYKWVPKMNPDKYDACETCMAMVAKIWGQG